MRKKIFYNRTGFVTLFKREINRFMKMYIQTLLAPLLSNLLFLGIFGGMLKTRSVGIEGVDYLSFLTPGLAAMGAIFASFQNPSFSIISQKYQDTLKDLNSYPMSDTEKVMAFVLSGTFRGVLIGTLTYIAAIFFIDHAITHPLVFIIMLAVISFIFSSIGVIVGLAVNSYERINFILSIVLTPMAYFGGVFFEADKLSGIFSNLVYINPLYPMINLVRFGFLGVSGGYLMLQFMIVFLILFGAFGTAFLCFKKGLGLKS